MSPQCSQPGCDETINARGLCSAHYKRWQRHGDPNANVRNDRDPADRFWERVEVGHPAGCWWWRGKINNNGYGVFTIGRRTLNERRTAIAHRFAYESLVALIPDGMQLDHLCRNRICVNPDHLQPVTPLENTLRASAARKRYCKRGHAFTPKNTYIQPSTGRRTCRTCKAEANSQFRERAAA
jgi:hypothetical protein